MHSRTSARCTRLAALLAVGSMAVLLPATPVYAQQDAAGYPEPPPVQKSLAPAPEPPSPDAKYQQETACVERGALSAGTVLPEAPWGQKHLRIEEAHQFATGEGEKVAVIDTGVNQHNFFSKPVEPGGDYVENGKDGLTDCDGHGTEVAGIIAGNPPRGQNIAFRGVAPGAQIMSIRQTSKNFKSGGGPQGEEKTAGSTETLAKAVMVAANRGASVINISVDNCRPAGPISAAEQQLQAAIRTAVDDHNAVVVAAAGNTSDACQQNDQPDVNNPTSIVTPPWFADDVLSVAAIQEDGSVADFSVRGPWVSVAAPGTNIVSLDPADPTQLANRQAEGNQEPGPIQGTSFAAPYVSGVVALVRERFPQLSARQVMNRITSTAQHPAAPGGRDSFIGSGVVNPIAALTGIVPEEENIPRAQAQRLPADLPAPNNKDWAPLVVALSGTGGAVLALGITMFVLHARQRHRRDRKEPRGFA
ncbi:MAG: type VII secretion-associated serine protease mycosin [Pseudonocardiaceae bacterium]|nr:type VII secretion-associated serine protease mycosin [Pseudonocardiaceae bacterium]